MKKTIYIILCILLVQLLNAQEKNVSKANLGFNHTTLMSSISIYSLGMTADNNPLKSSVDINAIKSYPNIDAESKKMDCHSFTSNLILKNHDQPKSWNFIYHTTNNYEDGGTFNKRVYGINYGRGKSFSFTNNYSLHASWSLGLGTMNVNLPTETDLSLMHTLSNIASSPAMLIWPYKVAGSFLYPVIGCNIKIQ